MKTRLLSLLCLVCCLPLPTNASDVYPSVTMEGTCAQLLASIEGKTPNAAGTFLLYRALIDGKTTRYNYALLAAGYNHTLTPTDANSTFMVKQTVTQCLNDAHNTHYNALTNAVLAQRLATVYPQSTPQLDFNAPLISPDPQRFATENAVVGMGKNKCAIVLQRTRSTLGEAVFHTWLNAYLHPQNSSNTSLASSDAAYQQTLAVCRENPDLSFAAAVLTVSTRYAVK